MKILHINCNYFGATLHRIMVENLNRHGHSGSVFVPTYSEDTVRGQVGKDVQVCVCYNKWDRLVFRYKQRKLCAALEERNKVSEYDLLHAYTLFTDGNCARKMWKKYGVPYVVAVRNTDMNVFFRWMPHLRSLGVQIMRDAKAVFFLSEAYKNQIFEKYVPAEFRGQLERKSYIMPNGIDDFWLQNVPEKENRLAGTVKLLYAGCIDRNKNITTTQKAAQFLREKGYDVRLTVVGKVTEEAALEEIRKDQHTQILPLQPKEELLKLYRQHNIFVMPSFTETFGLVYAEAMSQGLPVIYSEGQGFDRQFPEGYVGYHVPAGDVQQVADGIEKVIKNFDEIKQNVVCAAKSFDWVKITAEYDRIYKQVL